MPHESLLFEQILERGHFSGSVTVKRATGFRYRMDFASPGQCHNDEELLESVAVKERFTGAVEVATKMGKRYTQSYVNGVRQNGNGNGHLLEGHALAVKQTQELVKELLRLSMPELKALHATKLMEDTTHTPFTGIDSHGHKWSQGKQVAIGKEQGPGRQSAAGQQPAIPPAIAKPPQAALAAAKAPPATAPAPAPAAQQTPTAQKPAAAPTPAEKSAPPAPAGAPIAHEPKTPPPPGAEYNPDVFAVDANGITKAARIGVPAMEVPPPPQIGKLPNLTPLEREVEGSFIKHFEANPDKVAQQFRDAVHANRKPGDPPTFGTDDAKELHPSWTSPDMDLGHRSENRATLNCALHQTANAIAKRAFLQELDTMKAGDSVTVTVGGCGAGKGYSLSKVPEAMALKQQSKAVWDSAGDQNATENSWIKQECDKRGIKTVFAFVHADPKVQWAHPDRGVVKRAGDPKDGRMVDADVFADSYAIGAKNHQAFYEKHKEDPNSTFVFLSNGAKIDGVPQEALSLDRDALAKFARETVKTSGAPPHVVRGATVGERIWGARREAKQ